MLHGSTHPGVAGSELTRLLARFADAPPADTRPVFAERLGHWLGWTGAISLSAALNTGPDVPAVTAAGRPRGRPGEEADFQRVRAALEASIAAGPREPASSPTDFGPYRRHCLDRQQAMQDAIGALRQRLRDALSRRSADGARLAAIDAVMDRTLAEHERSLLGLVPLRLQAHFERLLRSAAARAPESGTLAAGPDTPAAEPDGPAAHTPDPAALDAALATFRDDLDAVLRAELAHRLLPARGLLDTLQDTLLTLPPT